MPKTLHDRVRGITAPGNIWSTVWKISGTLKCDPEISCFPKPELEWYSLSLSSMSFKPDLNEILGFHPETLKPPTNGHLTAEIRVKAIYDQGRTEYPLLEIVGIKGVDDQAHLAELLWYAITSLDKVEEDATESPEVEQSETR